MQVKYQYSSPSICKNTGSESLLGLSTDLGRDEEVSFLGKVKNPLIFRDAMLMLREIVVSDMRQEKKNREDFFTWLDGEIEKRVLEDKGKQSDIKSELKIKIDSLQERIDEKDLQLKELTKVRNSLNKEINKLDMWGDYNNIERDFWKYIYSRDKDLWFVLDPVITVHKDMVSFEAFSLDESSYGCLSVDMNEFELLQEPKLGTTNIDFSAKLAREMERFRTYTDVKLSVNPGGFTVDSGVMPEYVEKKIDLPETWIKGFNQVSAAASMDGLEVELSKVDIYDICSFLKRHKANKSPRYMKWIMEPGKNIKILFEPFGKTLTLHSIYTGNKKREEKIWGRRRWLVLEKLIPITNSFKIKLLGFGMPQFIIADLGGIKMTIGFTSWSSNDWVKGTAFNILAGFIGEGNYEEVYKRLKVNRAISLDEFNNSKDRAALGMVFRKGEGYFDIINNKVRFRQLCNVPLDKELYEFTELEKSVQGIVNESLENLIIKYTSSQEFVLKADYKIRNPKFHNGRYYGTPEYRIKEINSETTVLVNDEGQISEVSCNCGKFKSGSRNASEPCEHILALYANSSKFFKLELEKDKEYKIKDIMEMLI